MAPTENPHARNSANAASETSAGEAETSWALRFRTAAIKRTRQVKANEMTSDNADRRCHWNGDDQPKKAKQLSEGKEREHQPDRMKSDRFADELGRKDISFEELTASNNAESKQEQLEAWPSLKEGNAKRKHQRGQRANIRHEAQKAADNANQKTIVKTDQRQANAVPEPQEQADDRLAAYKTRQRVVYFSGDLSQSFAMVERKPRVELRDHPVPVDKNIKGDDRRDDQERQEIEQRSPARHQPCESVEKPLCALCDEVADGFLNLRARQLLAEPKGIQPMAAVFRNQRVALLYRDRLQPHCIAGQVLSEGNELTAQHRDDENKKKDDGQDENRENKKRCAEATES